MWDVSTLKTLPTIFQGQCCDCKVNDNGIRIWVCRVAGGVTIEQYKPRSGRWETVQGNCQDSYEVNDG